MLEVVLALLLSLRDVASVDLTNYLPVHSGWRYENVSSESQESTVSMCTIMCVMQKPSPCYAFNYRATDQSCQLILNGTSRLVQADGYQSYAQSESKAS